MAATSRCALSVSSSRLWQLGARLQTLVPTAARDWSRRGFVMCAEKCPLTKPLSSQSARTTASPRSPWRAAQAPVATRTRWACCDNGLPSGTLGLDGPKLWHLAPSGPRDPGTPRHAVVGAPHLLTPAPPCPLHWRAGTRYEDERSETSLAPPTGPPYPYSPLTWCEPGHERANASANTSAGAASMAVCV